MEAGSWGPHEQVERLTGAIYATIVVAGVLAASEWDPDPQAGDTGLYAFATVLVLWATHAWAHTLGHRYMRDGQPGGGLGYALAHDWPVVQASLPALAALAIARMAGASDETSIDLAFWVCVATLAAVGALIAWRNHESPWRIVAAGAGCGLLGFSLVLLKELLG